MAELFNITHEGNNLTEYTSTATDSGDLSVSASAALGGTSYGLSVYIDNSNAKYGQKDFTACSTFRCRFYFDPNSATGISGYYIRLAGGSDSHRASIYSYYNTGSFRTGIRITNDGGTTTYGSYVAITDAPHWIEFEWKAATSAGANNGYVKMWIDKNSGTADSESTAIDNDTHTVNSIRIGVATGADASGGAGTWYLDQIKANNDGGAIGVTTTYTQAVSGSVSSSGAAVRGTNRGVSGSTGSAGVVARRANRSLAGGLPSAGSLARAAAKSLAGALTPAGVVARAAARSLAGTLTTGGATQRDVSRIVSGALTPAGAATRQSPQSLAGVLSSAGSLAMVAARSLAGTLTTGGALSTIAATALALPGALSSAATLGRRAARSLAGATAWAGAAARLVAAARTGAISPAGATGRQSAKAITGATALAGAVSTWRVIARTVSGALDLAGSLVRAAIQSLAGGLTTSGVVSNPAMAELFNITHEDGDLSEYDSTVIDGYAEFEVTEAAAMAGTNYGLQFTNSDDWFTASAYGVKTFTATGEFRVRFYFAPNDTIGGLTTGEGVSARLLSVYNSDGDEVLALKYTTQYESVPAVYYFLTTESTEDGGVSPTYGIYGSYDLDSHYIEIHVKAATSDGANDGFCYGWVDGVLVMEEEGLDNDIVAAEMSSIRVGVFFPSPTAGQVTGMAYFDEIKARSDGEEIGPIVNSYTATLTATLAPLYSNYIIIRRAVMYLVGGGNITPAADLPRQSEINPAASLPISGAAIRQTALTWLAGALSFAGDLAAHAIVTLAATITGGVTPTGALSTTQMLTTALTGVLGLAGTLTNRARAQLAATLSGTGEASTRQALVALIAAALPGVGTLINQAAIALTGNLPTEGTTQQNVNANPAGTLDSGGGLVNEIDTVLTGDLPTEGTTQKTVSSGLAGVLDAVGGLINQAIIALTGGLTGEGAIQQTVSSLLIGVLDSVGTLVDEVAIALTGDLPTEGTTQKTVSSGLAGVLDFAGGLINQAVIALTGNLPTEGSTQQTISSLLIGALDSVGRLINQFVTALSGSLPSEGAIQRAAATNPAGTLDSGGGLVNEISTALTGDLGSTGSVSTGQALLLSLSGAVGIASASVAWMVGKGVTGLISWAGELLRQITGVRRGDVTITITAVNSLALDSVAVNDIQIAAILTVVSLSATRVTTITPAADSVTTLTITAATR